MFCIVTRCADCETFIMWKYTFTISNVIKTLLYKELLVRHKKERFNYLKDDTKLIWYKDVKCCLEETKEHWIIIDYSKFLSFVLLFFSSFFKHLNESFWFLKGWIMISWNIWSVCAAWYKADTSRHKDGGIIRLSPTTKYGHIFYCHVSFYKSSQIYSHLKPCK